MFKKSKTIGTIFAVILFFTFVIIFLYVSNQPGVLLSCEQGDFVRFIKISNPAKIVYLPGTCSGKVLIQAENGETVCETDDYNAENDKIVQVPCSDLRHYKNQDLNLTYWTYSTDYGNKTGSLLVSYP